MNQKSTYVLESESEFERLEKQSQTPGYDYQKDLADIIGTHQFTGSHDILDAGCGSGIVARHLAHAYPETPVHACDFSELRVKQAKAVSANIPNIHFSQSRLESLHYSDKQFDLIICRFVLQHLRPSVRDKTIRELLRCLKPGGILRIIETDGLFFNLSPISKKLARQLEVWRADDTVDMFVSRKLPRLLLLAGFGTVDWEIRTVDFQDRQLAAETQIYSDRFEQALPLFERVLGSRLAARRFASEFIKTLKQPGTVIFHNQFLITARRSPDGGAKVRLLRS